MAAQNGNGGSVLYLTGGTTVITGVGEWSINPVMEPTEHIAFTEDWVSNFPGPRKFSGSFAGRGEDDASQDTLRSAQLGGSAVALRLHTQTAEYWNIGTAYLTGQSDQLNREGIMERSWDFVGSGALTYV